MTTYFIYSALGYMGDQAGNIFAALETGAITPHKIESGIFKELGTIEVYLFSEKSKK